jgi:hypothetical protein
MSDKNILDFDKAKQPHVLTRAEGKVKAMRKAFKQAREEANPKSRRKKKRNNKKKR